MDEAQQPAAAAPLSDQPSATDQQSAPAAATAVAVPLIISPAPTIDSAPVLSRPWMEAHGENGPVPADPPDWGDVEQRCSRSQPVAPTVSPAASPAAAAAVSEPLPAWRAAPHGGSQKAASSAKRSREETKAENERDEPRPLDELRWMRWQHAQKERAAAASAATASATASPRLFLELIGENEAKHRVELLHIGLLPQEWFVDPVPDELVCCICTEVARDPPNLEVCGHAVCRDCLTQHRRRSSTCPLCRLSFLRSKLASQPFVQSMVWRMRVRCVQHDKGCGWQGQLGTEMRELKAHDAACQFKQATCLACSVKCLIKDMPDHHRNCPHRRVACTSCHKHMCLSHLSQHQPAMPPAADAAAEVCPHDEPHADLPTSDSSMELGESDGEDEAGQDADADASSPILVDASSDGDEAEAVAAAAPAAAAAPEPAAVASNNNLLPPVIPPCSASEVCPRGCEDPQQPGSD